MKRIVLTLLSLSLIFTLGFSAFTAVSAEGETSEEEYILVPKSYLESLRDEIKKEVLAEFQEELDKATQTGYKEVTAKQGQVILLTRDSEIIYRGGGAVAITSTNASGEGIWDISCSKEIFSGQKLEFGHIYSFSKTDSVKAVLITGVQASFTVRGNYEIG